MLNVNDFIFDELIRTRKLNDDDLKVEWETLHKLVFDTPSASWVDVRLYENVDNELLKRGIDMMKNK